MFQAAGIGAPAYSHQYILAIEALLPLRGAGYDLLHIAFAGNELDLCSCDNIDASLTEYAHKEFAYLVIHRCENVRQHLNHSDLRTHSIEHAGQFHADHSAADADDAFGRIRQVPAGVTIDHIVAIDAGKRWHQGYRPRGKDDLICAELLRVAIFCDGNCTRGVDCSQAIEHIDIVPLHECPDAAGHALDHFVLEGDGLAHIEGRRLW